MASQLSLEKQLTHQIFAQQIETISPKEAKELLLSLHLLYLGQQTAVALLVKWETNSMLQAMAPVKMTIAKMDIASPLIRHKVTFHGLTFERAYDINKDIWWKAICQAGREWYFSHHVNKWTKKDFSEDTWHPCEIPDFEQEFSNHKDL